MSSPVDILVPKGLWDASNKSAVSAWYYGDGDQVDQGTTVCEIMVEKTAFEVEAPISGILTITAQKEDVVAQGDVLGRISPNGG